MRFLPWPRKHKQGKSGTVAVIIPTLNEENNIKETLRSLLEAGACIREVIVVDGGSKDRTRAVAHAAGAKVLSAPRGRGQQLNVGWRHSSSPWCLFLHADSQLPQGFCSMLHQQQQQQQGNKLGQQQQQQQQETVLSDQSKKQQLVWGCFSSIWATGIPGWQARLLGLGVRLRTQLLHLPYGDQGLLVRRDILEQLQGFKEWGLLEDVELVKRLNLVSTPMLLPGAMQTSGRRYSKVGFFKNIALNQGVLAAWAAGMDVEQLAAWYQQADNPPAPRNPPSSGSNAKEL